MHMRYRYLTLVLTTLVFIAGCRNGGGGDAEPEAATLNLTRIALAPAKLWAAWSTLDHDCFLVHLRTLQVFHTRQLLLVPGGAYPLPVSFGLYPDLDYDGPYGQRWRSSLDARLDMQVNGDVVYTDYHGVPHTFASDGEGGFTTPLGCCSLLEEVDDTYRLTDADRWVKIFDLNGLWTGLQRPDCQVIQFTREPDHRLTRIDTPEGRTYMFAYATHLRLETITDFAGREHRFSYDGAGRLTTIRRPQRDGDGTPPAFRYTYDAAHRLRSVLNSAGQTYGTASYNAAGEVTAIATPNGTATYARVGASVQATGRDGSAWEFFLTATGQIDRILNPAGGTRQYAYDGSGRRTGVTEPSGRSVTSMYSAAVDPREFCNRITSRTEPANFPESPALVSNYEFLAGTNLWTAQIKPDGSRTDWTYNAKGQLSTTTMPATRTTEGPERGVWQYRYDELGRLTEQETPTGSVTTYEYGDGAAVSTDLLVREIRDAGIGDDPKTGRPRRNETITYTYDAAGLRTRVTNADGTFQTLTYDAWDNFTSITDEAGITSMFTYDGEGRLVRTERPHCDHEDAPIGSGTISRTFTFDVFGQPLSIAIDDAFTTRTKTFVYGNGQYRPSRVVEPGGRTTDYTYDFNGRRTLETSAPGTAGASSTSWSYVNNKLMVRTDPLGNETTFAYDGYGRRISETDAKGNVRRFTFDACGRTISSVREDSTSKVLERSRLEYDGLGNVTAVEIDQLTPDTTERIDKFYDRRGFLVEERLPGGGVRLTCADALGLIVREEEQPLDRVFEYDYDARRQLTEKRVIRGASTPAAATATTTLTYDVAGQLLGTVDPLNRTTMFLYDCNGNISRMATPDGKTANYTWDGRGELRNESHTDGQDTLGGTYTYNAAGRFASRSVNGVTTAYAYDNQGRLATVSVGGQQVKSYSYDRAHRILNTIDPGGTISYSYDAVGNVVAKSAGNQRQSFVYDGLNRIVSAVDRAENGTEVAIARTYDGFGNVLSDTQNGMGVQKTYASVNQPDSLRTPNMNYSYEYDSANRIASVDRGGQRYFDYTYAPGTRKIATRAHTDSGLTSTFEYDLAGKTRRAATTTPGGGADTDFSVARNNAGLVTEQSRQDGSLTERFAYDALGRMKSQTHVVGGGADRTTTYRFLQDSDKLASIANTRDGSDAAVSYDALGRMTQVGDSVLTYGADLHASNMFDDRPAYQPQLSGRTAPRVEYTIVHDRWGRVSEVRSKADNELVACFYYDVLNRPIVAQELEFTGNGLLTRHRVFDGCKLVYEFSPVGFAGFDLFYAPDPASDGHLASGFDDSFFSENLFQVDAQWVPRQLFNLDQSRVQERYDDFSALGTPHFEFPDIGDPFRGAPSLQSLANPPGYASSYASGLMFTWAGPLDDPFLPRPLPYVPGGLPLRDGQPRVGPVNPPGPGPFAPPVPPAEENQRDCTEARDRVQAAVNKMDAICQALQSNDRDINDAQDRLDEANDRVNTALRNARDILEDIAEFNKAKGRIKFAQDLDTAISLATGIGGIVKQGAKVAKNVNRVTKRFAGPGSRVLARRVAKSAQTFVNNTFVSDTSMAVIKAALKSGLKNGLEIDVSISGYLLAYGQLLMGVEVDGVQAELKAQAYRFFVDLELAQNARGRAEKHLNGLLDERENLLGQAADSIGCLEDALKGAEPWREEIWDLVKNGTEIKQCFATYAAGR